MGITSEDASAGWPGRRSGKDRRRSTLRALIWGSFKRRRRSIRRSTDQRIASIDWHHPQWLAVSMLILLLSAGDAFMTLTLISLGAEEANPFMQPLVVGNGPAFALWKMGLTAFGVVTLTILAQLRTIGRLPIGVLLYGILVLYIALIGYEFWLLDYLLSHSV